jgi:yecA family protein
MDIAMIEGYLVALLVWPVAVPPGAWLPPIWGERGWKVPEKLASPDAYARFTALIVGFLQELDRGLSAHPPCFAPTLTAIESPSPGRTPPGSSWAQGFLQALQQGLQGLAWRSSAARAAVARIARHASLAAPAAQMNAAVTEDLTSAVLTLAGERSNRGPLGALD